MKTKNKFTLGFEVEGLYRFIENEGGYGQESSEPLCDYWSTSEDSSIEGGSSGDIDPDMYCEDCEEYGCECGACDINSDGEWSAVEIVSDVLTTDNYKQALKTFQNVVSTPNTKKLVNLAEFNSSTGCHIHFGVPGESMRDFMSVEAVIMFRKVFERKLMLAVKHKLIDLTTVKKVLDHYYRGYAKNNVNNRGERGSLNFPSEWNTIEWRSFNLYGVKTWKEFHNIFDIAISTIDYMISNRHKAVKAFTIEQ